MDWKNHGKCSQNVFPFAENSLCWEIPRWLSGKESVCIAGDACSIPGLERSPGEGKGNSPQCSCLGNPMDRGAWQAMVHRVAESDITRWLKNNSLFKGLDQQNSKLSNQGWALLERSAWNSVAHTSQIFHWTNSKL